MRLFGFGRQQEDDRPLADLISFLPKQITRGQAQAALSRYEFLGEQPLPRQLKSYKDDVQRTVIYETEEEVVSFNLQEALGIEPAAIFPGEVECLHFRGIFRREPVLAILYCRQDSLSGVGVTLFPDPKLRGHFLGVALSAKRHLLEGQFIRKVFGESRKSDSRPCSEWETPDCFALLCMTLGPSLSFFAFDTNVVNRSGLFRG